MRTVSVVVCTHDRPDQVAACVRSLANEPAHEVMVIANACRLPLPDLGSARVVEEPMLGVSNARNRGLAEATGDVVLFFDDDTTVHPGAVAAHAAAYEDGVVAVGGRIDFASTAEKPRWLDPSLESLLTIFDRGPEPHDLPDVADFPYAANLSFDRARVIEAGGFNPALSRVGQNLLAGEETELLMRLRARGGRIRWCPDAVVDHHVPPSRLRLWWFVRRAWAQGTTDVLCHRHPHQRRNVLGLLKLAVLPGGTEWPPSGPPALAPRLAVELVRRVRLLGAAAYVARS